jgi:asparagine N-glycosylation enzyme membrane subunit Stt3
VQTPKPYRDERSRDPAAPAGPPLPRAGEGLWGLGERLTWLSGLILAVSAFTGWYAGSGDGVQLSVTGWHSGSLGKLVFFVGLAVLALVALREAGIDLPATVPESLVVVALGSLATVFVLVRLVSVPERLLPVDGRGIGIWISLGAALAVIAAGLLRAAEEL